MLGRRVSLCEGEVAAPEGDGVTTEFVLLVEVVAVFFPKMVFL